jgi:PAS domain S-box-containing protein
VNNLHTSAADSLLEALPLPLLLFGPDRLLRLANAAFLAFSGIPAERLRPGLTLTECARLLAYRGLLGPGDPEQLAREAAAVDRSRASRRLLHGVDGRIIEVHTAPTADGGFLTQAVDVTAIVSAQGEAARHAQRLSEIVAALVTGVAAFGPDMRLAVSNPAFGRLIGLPATLLHEDMPAAAIIRLLEERGEFAAMPQAMVERLLPCAGGGPTVIHRRRPTGEVVETRAIALPDGGMLLEVSDVTARQKAEDDARRRAALLDAILDALPHGVCVYGPDDRVVLVNQAHREMIGAARIGVRLADMLRDQAEAGAFGPGDPAALAAAELAVRRGGLVDRIRRRRDGLIFSHRVAPLPDGGHVSVVTDVTALARAEAEAKGQAALLRALVEGMPFGVHLYDAAERLVAFNAVGETITGLEPGTLRLGMTAAEVIALQEARGEFATAPGHLASITGLDRTRPKRHRRTRPDGSVLDVQSLPMPDGGFLVTFQDVTPIVRAEQEARAQAALLRAMIDNTEHGVLLFDRDERLVALNAAASRFEGFAPGDSPVGLTRREVLEHVARTGGFGSAEQLETVLSSPAATHRAYRRTGADGTVLDITARPMPDGGFVVSLTDVTQLVVAERNAERRADMLRGILDNMAAGVLLYDAEGRLVARNALALALTGLSEQEAVPGARSIELLRLLQERGEIQADLEIAERIAVAGARQPIRYTRTRPDGTVLEVASAPMPDGGFVVTLTDVTRLARAEEDAARRAALLQGMIDNAAYGIVLYDASHRFVAGNALAFGFIGLDESELRPGTPSAEVIARQVAKGMLTEEAAASRLAVDRTRPNRYRRVNADGTVLDIESKPMPDGGFVVTFADVTTLVRAEEEARQRAALQAAMLDNMRHGLALFDADSRLIAANPLAARLTGLPPEVVRPGVTIAELRAAQIARGEFSPEEAERRGLATLDTAPPRYVRTRPDGTVIEVTTDRTPEGFFVRTFADVTEDRRIRADLEAARAASEAAARAKSRFLATMTHELRTPLNAVIGFADLLKTPQPSQEVQEYAGLIAEAGRELLGLIDQILDVARSETAGLPVRAGRVDLRRLLAHVVETKGCAAATGRITLTLELPPSLPEVTADAARLEQVVQGLLSNALKFTDAGGRVTLSACQGAEGEITIRVADTGIGIPDEALPRAFEPFAQLDSGRARRYAGSGIGLYLARSIAEAMGMRLTLSSKQGEGTVATLLIPPELACPPEEESA